MMKFLVFLLIVHFTTICVRGNPVEEAPPGRCVNVTSYADYLDIVQNSKDKVVVMDLGTKESPAFCFLTPRLEWLAKKFAGRVIVIVVDYMLVPRIYWDIKCKQIPCVVIFKNGKVVDALENDNPYEIDQRIQKVLDAEKS